MTWGFALVDMTSQTHKDMLSFWEWSINCIHPSLKTNRTMCYHVLICKKYFKWKWHEQKYLHFVVHSRQSLQSGTFCSTLWDLPAVYWPTRWAPPLSGLIMPLHIIVFQLFALILECFWVYTVGHYPDVKVMTLDWADTARITPEHLLIWLHFTVPGPAKLLNNNFVICPKSFCQKNSRKAFLYIYFFFKSEVYLG